ncbi:hypothetical protein AB0J72_33190 [Dactylosporangium sp. NPDC049742]|uniref:hypothetical protein n=1 Tax=Dactylosporangium sp. NPDC049742 TaxID=3154737 RepID=UPI0034129EEE
MPGAHTGLSPEWDRGFDAAFAELIGHDHDFVDTEFTALTTANWPAPPDSPPPASTRRNQTLSDNT